MKSGLLIFCLLVGAICSAQDREKVVGEWKVVSMKNDRMFLDLKADTIYLNKTLEEKLLDVKDFDLKKELTKQAVKQYFASSFYEFRNDMTYLDNAGENGTYSIDTIKKIITINVPEKEEASIEKKHFMKYEFRGKRLTLTDSEIDNGAYIELEKQ